MVTVSENSKLSADQIRMMAMEEHIETRPIWKPMHLQPVFQDAPYFGGSFAEECFNNGLYLPSGSNLTDEDWERIDPFLQNI